MQTITQGLSFIPYEDHNFIFSQFYDFQIEPLI